MQSTLESIPGRFLRSLHRQQTPEEDTTPDTWTRILCGAVVQFGEGAAVLKASLQSDFSAVRLSMLPPGSSPATISTLLTQLGFPTPPESIRLPPAQDPAAHCTADVRVEDPSFAKHLCAAIGSRVRPTVSQLTAVPINAPMPGGLNSHRVECKKVHVSWHRPFKIVWLNFWGRAVAEDINTKFSTGEYTVLGQVVGSSGPSGQAQPTGRRNPLTWTVTLTDVPGRATSADGVRSFPSNIKAGHVEMGKASYGCDIAEANAVVKSKLAEVGPLEWWEDAAAMGGKRAKGKARFRDEGDAAKAAAVLNEWTLPFSKKSKVTVQALHSARFKVLDRIYRAVEAQVVARNGVWLAKHVFFTAYEPSRANRVLRLEGEDSSHVAEAKQALEKILAGKLAMVEDHILWAPSFGVNGDVYQRLKAMELTLGIVILRDKRRSRLHLFGPPEKCAEAQSLLAALAKEDSSTTSSIPLDDETFLWACLGGFKKLGEVLGKNVVFDIISTPKRILVTGSDMDYKLAVDIVTGRKEGAVVQNVKAPPTTADCAICWTEAENPIRTRCGHAYCSDCFENFSRSEPLAGDNFCIQCTGDSSNCKTVLALDELQDHLSSNTFDAVLEASFAFYLRRRPEAFHYCPTADCGQTYRPSTREGTFTCPKCLGAVCTSCHAKPHQGMTCAEHKYSLSDEHASWEKAKKKLGIKECPKCKTAIEKTFGCDHMTCGGCQTHICWRCLAVFETGDACYDHMSKKHEP